MQFRSGAPMYLLSGVDRRGSTSRGGARGGNLRNVSPGPVHRVRAVLVSEICKGLNDPALLNHPAFTTRRHTHKLGSQGGQPAQTRINFANLLGSDDMGLPAARLRTIGQVEQGTDSVALKAQLSRMADKPKPPQMRRAIGAMPALGAGWRWQPTLLLVPADRRRFDPRGAG